MTFKKIGHLSYAASSFVHHFIAISEFKLELQSGNPQFGSKSSIFLAPVTLKFDRWPWKTIGHLSYATSSCGHHFIAISEFKLEFRVRKRSIRVKIVDFLAPVTLKFDRWHWKTIGHLSYATSSFVHHFRAISEIKLELQSGNAQFGSKSARVTLKFDEWPWKSIGHLFYASSSYVHHFVTICEFKLKLQSGIAKFGSHLAIFGPLWPWNLTDDIEKQ